MSLECQIVKVKKVPYSETDPVFTAWAKTYSAIFYSTYTTVFSYSAIWSSGGATSLSSLTANWQNTYNFFSVQSANNISVYNTVNSNSATNWNYQGNDIKALTGNWQNTFNNFSVQSADNESVYNTVQTNSSLWIIDSTADNQVRELTANWQNTYSVVSSNSSNWNSVYNTFNSQSANNQSVYSVVNSNSATNWNYQGTDIKSLTANWQDTFTNFSVQSANNDSVYNNVNSNSATNWNYQGTDIKALTGNWQNTFTNFSVQSANNIRCFNTVNSNSANWGLRGTGLTLFREVSSTTGVNFMVPVYALSATSGDTNIDVAILPKGTGSFSLQIPDGTTSGGNKRGTYAIDFQRVRGTSGKIASSSYSVIINGDNNVSSSNYSTIINGSSNTSSNSNSTIINGDNNISSNLYSTIINGRYNTSSGGYSIVINGFSNTSSANNSTVINGVSNTSSGTYSTVINGESNNSGSNYSTVINGSSNSINNTNSTILGGDSNQITSAYSTILNSYYAVADRFGQISKSNSRFQSNGDAQRTEFLLYGKSTNQISTELTLDNVSALLTITSNSFQLCTVQILGVDEDGNFSQFLRKMTVKNIGGTYTLSHIESLGTDVSDAGNCIISVDNTKGIVLTCGSLPDNNTVWLASINAVELFIPQPYTSVSMMSINHGINNTETDINILFS